MKRLLGKTYSNADIQRNQKYWTFDIQPDERNQPMAVVTHGNQPLNIRPIDVSAIVLKELKSAVERHARKTITRAVISVPAYFKQPQKRATKEAAEMAGFDVSRVKFSGTLARLALCIR